MNIYIYLFVYTDVYLCEQVNRINALYRILDNDNYIVRLLTSCSIKHKLISILYIYLYFIKDMYL